MKDIKQITRLFQERFKTEGQNGFSVSQDEMLIFGTYLKKVGKEMGIEDNFELLELFSKMNTHMKMLSGFVEEHEKRQKELEEMHRKLEESSKQKQKE